LRVQQNRVATFLLGADREFVVVTPKCRLPEFFGRAVPLASSGVLCGVVLGVLDELETESALDAQVAVGHGVIAGGGDLYDALVLHVQGE
jgi:hypothetical protein